ncbi:MAG: hypothetical protein GXP31_00990, partial [Kiritimatiellaeota bacterium]|nr:hypothetical protein [Kiritimatiellota bacterium]
MVRWPFKKKSPTPSSPVGDKETPARDSEHGVALLLTLGALALLMVLAVSFAFQSRVNLQGAQVNADTIRARLLAESALERAMAFLHYNYDYAGPPAQTDPTRDVYPATRTNGKYIFGYCNDGDWTGRFYAVSTAPSLDQAGVETALAANVGFDFTPSWMYQTDASSPHPLVLTNGLGSTWQPSWQHTWGPEPYTDQNGNGAYDSGEPFTDLNGNGSWDNDGALMGRIAFLVVDESGKLDPTSCVTFHEPYSDYDRNGSYTAGEKFWDWDGNSAYSTGTLPEGSEPRVGASTQEIDLIPAAINNTIANLFRSNMPGASGGTPLQWFSWYNIRQGIPQASMSDAQAKLCTLTLFPFSYDIEAYYTGGVPSSPANQFHRFDLVNVDWPNAVADKPTVPSLTGGSGTAFWDTSTTPPTITTSLPAGGGAIPWLSQMVAEDGTTSVSNQVAANLIDYCDQDSDGTENATSNYNPGALTATYCGLERVPYINEVQFE